MLFFLGPDEFGNIARSIFFLNQKHLSLKHHQSLQITLIEL